MPFRPGQSGNPAGRRPGLKDRQPRTTAARKVAAAAAQAGITPLEVMLSTMRELYDKGDHVAACAIARDAAPFCHPRLSSVQVDASVHRDAIDLSEAELLAIAAGGRPSVVDPEPGEDEPGNTGRLN